METQTAEQSQAVVNGLYNFAADLMVNQGKSPEQTKTVLMERGLSDSAAYTIVSNLEDQISDAKKSRAQKDMFYGALWCIGGTVATLANIGFIFWGAILFGGIQFFKGLMNYMQE
jgi:hypothetical protein